MLRVMGSGVFPALEADHAGHLETAVKGYAEALRYLHVYLNLETDESHKVSVSYDWGGGADQQ